MSDDRGFDAWAEAEGKLARRIDQLIGWAKANKTREYYWLAIENTDRLRDDILSVVAELGGLAADATESGKKANGWQPGDETMPR